MGQIKKPATLLRIDGCCSFYHFSFSKRPALEGQHTNLRLIPAPNSGCPAPVG